MTSSFTSPYNNQNHLFKTINHKLLALKLSVVFNRTGQDRIESIPFLSET